MLQDISAPTRSEALRLARLALIAGGYSASGADRYLSECDTSAPFYMECIDVEVSWVGA